MWEIKESALSSWKRMCCIKNLEKEDKLVDLKFLCAPEAPEGKKLQPLCVYDADLALVAL